MQSTDLILDILASVPGNEVRGKKRLQKISYLLKEAGVDCDAHFYLFDYGPFSKDIANATDILTLQGAVDEREEPIGAFNTSVTVYKLTDSSSRVVSDRVLHVSCCLSDYSTIELEVAATIKFFENCNLTDVEAENRTIYMKPNKALPHVIKKARSALACLER